MSSTELFEAASISITSSEFARAIDRHDSHSPHGSTVGPRSQFRQAARIFAIEVLPVPREPTNRYAWWTLPRSTAWRSVRTTGSCPTTSANVRGRCLRYSERCCCWGCSCADTSAESTQRGEPARAPARADSVRARERLEQGSYRTHRSPAGGRRRRRSAPRDLRRGLRELRHAVRAHLGRAARAWRNAGIRHGDRADAAPARRVARRDPLSAGAARGREHHCVDRLPRTVGLRLAALPADELVVR